MAAKLAGVLAGLGVLGTFVFAIVAPMTEPPLEPAHSFIDWQALWDGGRYGVKYTFAVTWFFGLVALVGPLGLFLMASDALRAERAAMPAWPRLEWKHMDEPTRARLGLMLTVLAALFGAVCLLDPEVFTPVGFLARIALILWPFALAAGPALLLDVTLPAGVVTGAVTALKQTPGPNSQSSQYHVSLGGPPIELPAALWRQLRVGDSLAIRRSGGFGRVLELARE